MQDIQKLAESDPRRFLGKSFALAYRAHRAGDWKLLELVDDLRLKAYSSLRLRLPSILASPPVLFVLVLVGYLISIISVRFSALVTPALFLTGVAVVTLFSHPLGHSVFVRLGGFKVNGFFLDGKVMVEPTILLSLKTYFDRPAESRFWLHLSGALFTLMSSLLFIPLVYFDGFSTAYWYFSLAFVCAVVLSEALHSSRRGDIRRAMRSRRMI